MDTLIAVLVMSAITVAGGLWFSGRWRQDRVARLRDQARLKVIEAQMAAMRAALRIQAAEHLARQRMRSDADGSFTDSTIHEGPEEWQWK